MNTYYFTYGSNHLDRQGNSLGDAYTPIEALDVIDARDLMFKARGPKFCTHYDTPEEAGVEKWELREVPLDQVTLDLNEEKVEQKLEAYRRDLDGQLELIQNRISNLNHMREVLRKLPPQLLDKAVEYNGQLDIESLSREESVEVLRVLDAGRWEKSQNAGVPGTLDYNGIVNGVKVRLWAAGAPDSCRVVEEEEIIPEQRVIRRKLICTPE